MLLHFVVAAYSAEKPDLIVGRVAVGHVIVECDRLASVNSVSCLENALRLLVQ